MTNSWNDIKNADVVLIMGGNAAEAHPCGFKWVTEAKANNGAKLIVVDPRFTRSASVSDLYCPLRAGSDIAFLGGVVNYLLTNDKIHTEYVKAFTNASYLVKDTYAFDASSGLFSGYDAEKRTYNRETWEYEVNAEGFAVVDETMQNPRSVFQLMKKHFARYTPEMVERITGAPKDKFLKVAELIATTGNGERAMTILYALGWTQHSYGSQIIRTAAMIQLLLGNMGIPGGGVNALRGHSNVQGTTDMGTLSGMIPGYLTMPNDKEITLDAYMANRNFKPLRPGQISFWQNYKKFFVSHMKSMYGANATPENSFGYDWLAKHDGSYDVLRQFELMHQGKINGMIAQGFNPLMSVSHKAKMRAALAKLKFLVSIDPLETETVRFWENHGEFNDAEPAKIQTEVFMLPSTCFAEDEGSFTNSSRNIIWHWKAGDAPGEARTDTVIVAELMVRLRKAYQKDGGKGADPFLKVDWTYKNEASPTAEELLKEINGQAVADLKDATDPNKIVVAKGVQLDSFALMRDDGTTSGANWIYTGCFSSKGNMTARRDNADPSGLGVHGLWGFAWPANRRVLYNRASADVNGKAWSERKKYIAWDGSKWAGPDVPDFPPTRAPDAAGPFIMNPEGVSRLWVRRTMADGPFPEHYEPFEAPLENVLHPKTSASPVARVFKGDLEVFGKAKDFPYVATTYRLVEHFHFWTKHAKRNAVMQPEAFAEISEELAKEKGIKNGSWVRVWSNRGSVKCKAVVTKRIPALKIDGKMVHTVGLPFHFGFVGETKKNIGANALTPYVGDANTNTPEFKAFLVDIEPLKGPAPVA